MNQTNLCPKCAANIAPHDFVCDYCGHVLFERVKNTDSLKSSKESFDEGMEIIKENLNALHDMPKPSASQTVKASLRLFFAFMTFGLILIFWHRPKKRFHKDSYVKLKSIIARNISFLKISSAGSNDLTARIKVLEDELLAIDKTINKGILAKTISYIIITSLYIIWFIYVVNKEPIKHSTYYVVAYDSVVSGNLSNTIHISKDSVKIIHTASGTYEEWELVVKLNTIKLQDSSIKELEIKNELVLTDEYGMEVKGFNRAEMDDLSKQKLISSILSYSSKSDYYKFLIKHDLNYPLYRDTLPVNIKNYILRIDSVPIIR